MHIDSKSEIVWKESISKSIWKYFFDYKWAAFCGLLAAVVFFLDTRDGRMDIVMITMHVGLILFGVTIMRLLYAISPRRIVLSGKYIKILKGRDVQTIYLDQIDVVKGYSELGMFSIHPKLFSSEEIRINNKSEPSYQEVAQWLVDHGVSVEQCSELPSRNKDEEKKSDTSPPPPAPTTPSDASPPTATAKATPSNTPTTPQTT